MKERIIRSVSDLTDFAVLFAALLIFLFGAYSVYDDIMIYSSALDTSYLHFKPGYEKEEEEDDREIVKEEMAAWIEIDGTSIDYPVMHTSNNEKYLNTDPFGDFSLSGSIFMDYRNEMDFSDRYNLLYGHHMENGVMFGALDAFKDRKYMEEHPKGTLTVGDKEYGINLFAFLETDATDKVIFAPDLGKIKGKMRYIKKNAAFLLEDLVPEKEKPRLIVLSTCKSPDSTFRTIVIGELVSGESGK